MSDDARDRARRRASWPGTLTDVGGQSEAVIVRHGTPGERVAMVWRITRDLWASSGRTIPSYTRAEMPGRIIRPGEAGRPQDLEDARRLEALADPDPEG